MASTSVEAFVPRWIDQAPPPLLLADMEEWWFEDMATMANSEQTFQLLDVLFNNLTFLDDDDDIRPEVQAASKQAITHNPKRPSSLLALPPELRTRIYELVLVKPSGRRIHWVENPHWTMTYAAVKEPMGLFRVSRRVRREALAVFYGSNTFHVPSLSALAYWLPRLTPEKRALLRKVWGFLLPEQVRADETLYDARKKAQEVEAALGPAGLRLEAGVFRSPARVRAGEDCRVWWVGSTSLYMMATAMDGSLGRVVGRANGESYLRREAEGEFEQEWEVVEAMWRAAAGAGCTCEKYRVERRSLKQSARALTFDG